MIENDKSNTIYTHRLSHDVMNKTHDCFILSTPPETLCPVTGKTTITLYHSLLPEGLANGDVTITYYFTPATGSRQGFGADIPTGISPHNSHRLETVNLIRTKLSDYTTCRFIYIPTNLHIHNQGATNIKSSIKPVRT